MIRAWLFDLDGTLISSVERFHDAYCSALRALDRPESTSRRFSGDIAPGSWSRVCDCPPRVRTTSGAG
jgi:phosphoglycolate phosphatase-like HAD superfamily hydrolase